MEPVVVGKPSSQELPTNQSQTCDNSMVVSCVAHFQQNPCQSSDPSSRTSLSITHLDSGSFDGDNQKEEGIRIAHGESCQHQLSEADFGEQLQRGTVTTSSDLDFGEHKTDDTLRTSQMRDEVGKGDNLRTRSVSRECRGKSFCCNFLRGRCFHGAACPDLHTEYTTYVMPGYDWCAKLHQEVLANSEKSAGSASNPEIKESDPGSSSAKTYVSPIDVDASVLDKDTNSRMNISFNHEGSEKSDDVNLKLAISSKRKRKRHSKFNKMQVDMSSRDSFNPATAVVNNKSDGECAKEATLNLKRKLLVLDVNGLLVDITKRIRTKKPNATLQGKSVYKRPFHGQFLDFCFEQFDVGLWSSRKRENVDKVVDLLMGKNKKKLLFCWDQSYCTDTGYKTLKNKEKPLVLKELKKLWEKHRPEVPWDKGYYNETNTVLLDDSPYKALRNPPHTAIFPKPFSARIAHDDSLGPKGDLRNYLMRLAEADDFQKFIRENPFGQPPITETSGRWEFYSQIASPEVFTPKVFAPKGSTPKKKKEKEEKKAASPKPTRKRDQ